MIIAVLSDIHDNIWKLAEATRLIRESQTERIIFCGDFCAPFTLKQLAEETQLPIDAVWGNNDGDQWLLTNLAAQTGNVTLHGQFAELEIERKKIAVNHYPEIARRVAQSGQFDLVCYGHDHKAHSEQVGETLLLNPGEIMGRFGKSTFALFDTQTCHTRQVEVFDQPQ
jgi:hypothetical protein